MKKISIAVTLVASLIIPSVAASGAAAAPVSTVVSIGAKTTALGEVAIRKISNKTVAPGKKAKIEPNIKTSGKAKITKKTITVKQGGKTIAKNKKSVKLKVGTYKVTTTVKYKVKVTTGGKTTWSKTKTKKISQTLKITKKATPAKAHRINTKAGQAEFVKLVNKERKAKGLNALVLDSELSKAAKLNSTGESADYDKLIDPNYSKKWNITKVTKYMEDGYEITSTQLRAITFVGGVSSSGKYASLPSDIYFFFLKKNKMLDGFWQRADGVGMYSNGETVFIIFGIFR